MGVLFMKGRERMWKNECVSIDLFIHVIFWVLEFDACQGSGFVWLWLVTVMKWNLKHFYQYQQTKSNTKLPKQ